MVAYQTQKLVIWSNRSTPGYGPKRQEHTESKTQLPYHVCSCMVCVSPKLKAMKVPYQQWKEKENMVHSGILFSYKMNEILPSETNWTQMENIMLSDTAVQSNNVFVYESVWTKVLIKKCLSGLVQIQICEALLSTLVKSTIRLLYYYWFNNLSLL